MSERAAWREEIRCQFHLAGPVVVVQLGLYAMGAVDAAFMGRVSAAELGAVALGHSFTFIFLGLAMGILGALDPIVAQAKGAGEEESIARALQRGIVLALGLSLLCAPIFLLAEPLLSWLGQPEEVRPVAGAWIRVSLAGVPGFLLFVAQRSVLQATGTLRPLVIAIVLANALNGALDWIWIEGNLGSEAYGAVGCAWATVVARWSLALMLPFLAGVHLRARLWPPRARVWSGSAFARTLKLGLPVGLSFGLEIGAFVCVLFLMGNLGTRELAAHQVVMSLASSSFMVPLAISMAAAVRAGLAIGRGDPAGLRRSCGVALGFGAATMCASAALFLLLPFPLARLFTDIPDVIAVAVTLIPIAGLFQVFDGLQGVAMGCLRGMADTRVPFAVHLLGFWGVAIPVSAFLGIRMGLGARGLWWGLAVGLALVAAVQVARVRRQLRRGVSRVVIEDALGDA